jgi:hypothetical protein
MDPGGAGSLDTFWRAAESFKTSPRPQADQDGTQEMMWAVSQVRAHAQRTQCLASAADSVRGAL